MFFLFKLVGHIWHWPGTLSTQPKQTIELCKHGADAPLLLAEKLRRGQSAIYGRSSIKYRDLMHDCFNGKVPVGTFVRIIIPYRFSNYTERIYVHLQASRLVYR